jgi:hypothetical protein
VKTYTYAIGAAYRRDIMIRLDQLGIPYTEHRTMFNSTIIVKTRTAAQEAAYSTFELEFTSFQRRLKDAKRQAERRRLEALRQEEAKKLARKNLFRKLTLRKPIESRWLNPS